MRGWAAGRVALLVAVSARAHGGARGCCPASHPRPTPPPAAPPAHQVAPLVIMAAHARAEARLAGLALTQSLQLAGMLQWMVRQSAEVENQMVRRARAASGWWHRLQACLSAAHMLACWIRQSAEVRNWMVRSHGIQLSRSCPWCVVMCTACWWPRARQSANMEWRPGGAHCCGSLHSAPPFTAAIAAPTAACPPPPRHRRAWSACFTTRAWSRSQPRWRRAGRRRPRVRPGGPRRQPPASCSGRAHGPCTAPLRFHSSAGAPTCLRAPPPCAADDPAPLHPLTPDRLAVCRAHPVPRCVGHVPGGTAAGTAPPDLHHRGAL